MTTYFGTFKNQFLIEDIEADDNHIALAEALKRFESGCARSARRLLSSLDEENSPLKLVLDACFSEENETESEFFSRHVALMQRAAALKCRIALFSLGVYFDTGQFVEQDKMKAEKYFSDAAHLGMPQAMHVFGIIKVYGSDNTERDLDYGLMLVSRAAQKGVAEAREFLEYLEQRNS